MESGKAGNQFTYRAFDLLGNIYQSKEKKDRVYGTGGRLLQKGTTKYKYDACGSLVKKTTEDAIWKYEYGCNSFMKKVVRPDGREVTFQYDALGRRIAKSFDGKTTRFLWDGDVILHEWEQEEMEEPKSLVTWLFDERNFTPVAKITKEEAYSVISDHLGTPFTMYDTNGMKVWENELDIYGKVIASKGDASHCYFRFPGQYEDVETGLYYNRFRYYDPDTGQYTQQDPIGLVGNNPTLYGYVWDTNSRIDPFGLFEPRQLFDGSVFRGVKTGQEPFFPSLEDIKHFKDTGTMPGLSTKPKLNRQTENFFNKMGAKRLQIDVNKLKNLSVFQDGKDHTSIMPSEDYLKKRGMSMSDTLDEWNSKGNSHELSKELKAAKH